MKAGRLRISLLQRLPMHARGQIPAGLGMTAIVRSAYGAWPNTSYPQP